MPDPDISEGACCLAGIFPEKAGTVVKINAEPSKMSNVSEQRFMSLPPSEKVTATSLVSTILKTEYNLQTWQYSDQKDDKIVMVSGFIPGGVVCMLME